MSETRCHRTGCPCTHDYPCSGGWIENPPNPNLWRETNGRTSVYDTVSPCPVCKPETTDALRWSRDREDAGERARAVTQHGDRARDARVGSQRVEREVRHDVDYAGMLDTGLPKEVES